MTMPRIFQVIAVGLAFVSIYLGVTDPRSDYFFAAVILTICSVFVAYRFYLKERIDAHDASTATAEGEDD